MAIRSPLYRADCLSFRNINIPTDQIEGVVQVLGSVTGINGKTTGATTIWTASADARILGAIIEVTAATAITVEPTAGIGVAAGEDDIFLPEFLTGLTASGEVWQFWTAQGLVRKVLEGEAVKLGIDTGATGTSMTLKVELIGYLIP